jgi:hypothetical protein
MLWEEKLYMLQKNKNEKQTEEILPLFTKKMPKDLEKKECSDIGKIEIWKPVKGFESLYEVSNLGRVKKLLVIGANLALLAKNIIKHI